MRNTFFEDAACILSWLGELGKNFIRKNW